jgi:hypothetical protein
VYEGRYGLLQSPMPDDSEGQATRALDLTAEEVEVLLKALRRYRNSIPIYLKSNQRELRVLDELLERLS